MDNQIEKMQREKKYSPKKSTIIILAAGATAVFICHILSLFVDAGIKVLLVRAVDYVCDVGLIVLGISLVLGSTIGRKIKTENGKGKEIPSWIGIIIGAFIGAIILLAVYKIDSGDKNATTTSVPEMHGVFDKETMTYTNSFFGFGCTLDDSWDTGSDEFTEALEQAKESNDLDDSFTDVYDLIAFNGGKEVCIRTGYDPEFQYETDLQKEDALRGMMNSLPTSINNGDLQLVSSEIVTDLIAGTEYQAIRVWYSDTASDIYVSEDLILVVKDGCYAVIMISVVGRDKNTDIGDIIELFYALDK